MQKETKLQEYIIKYFIITIICVSLVENLISYVFDQWIFPVLEVFKLNGNGIDKLSLGEIVVFLLMLFVQFLLGTISKIMPAQTRSFWISLSERVRGYTVQKYPRLGEKVLISEINNQRIAIILLVLAGILLIYLIPYVVGVFCFSKSVLKKVREQEKRHDEERKEFDRKRNLMLSDIAHDLRTPMTTINGYAKAINDGMVQDPAKQREYLNTMQIKAKRMNELVELLFEYVKLDSEGFKLEKEKIDINELLRENAALMYSDIEEAGFEFEIDIPDDSMIIEADKLQISRVITNLLVNAVRHNKEKTTIKLAVKKLPGIIVIDVADNGDPIPEDIAQSIFDPFAKADKSRSNKGGSGLGLSIAKKVVKMHGWKINLNTEYSGFTKAFEIRIPISEN